MFGSISFLVYILVAIHDLKECNSFVVSNIILSQAQRSRVVETSYIQRTSHDTEKLILGVTNRSRGSRKKKKKKRSTPIKSDTNENPKYETESKSKSIYSLPSLYDLAFGYRDYEQEVNFLLASHEKHSQNTDAEGQLTKQTQKSESNNKYDILELAAGPARHSITASKLPSVKSCTAIDISSEMIQYSNEVANEELGDLGSGGLRDKFSYECANMKSFNIQDLSEKSLNVPSHFDCVWILLGSLQHLTSNKDVISCFKNISKCLNERGTLIVELPHPKEIFSMVSCTRNGWEVPLEDDEGNEYGELKVLWGDADDHFDPVRQVRDFTVAMELSERQHDSREKTLTSVKEVVPMRLFTAQEMEALGQLSGLEMRGQYGALEQPVVDVNDEDAAFRLVCVFGKK